MAAGPVGQDVPVTSVPPPRVAIFGSCVTRDLFDPAIPGVELVLYGSRSSLISVVSDPVPISEDVVALESRFQRRCVVEDFRKTFFARLEEEAPDRLIVDLIDERFDVLATDGSYVTRSSEFVRAGLDALEGFDFRPVTRRAPELPGLFHDAADRFAERVLRVMAPEDVILHRAAWMTGYRSGDRVERFTTARQAFADEMNALLDLLYGELVRAFDGRAQLLELDRHRYLAADNRWGLEPYHYEPAYNEAAIERLRELLLGGVGSVATR